MAKTLRLLDERVSSTESQLSLLLQQVTMQPSFRAPNTRQNEVVSESWDRENAPMQQNFELSVQQKGIRNPEIVHTLSTLSPQRRNQTNHVHEASYVKLKRGAQLQESPRNTQDPLEVNYGQQSEIEFDSDDN